MSGNFSQLYISVVATVSNVEDSIGEIYKSLSQNLRSYDPDYEIIFVDNGSVDKTKEILSKIARQDHRIKVIRLRSNLGESCALDAGLKLAKGEVVVYFAGRVHVNPRDIDKLLDRIEKGYDLVVGWRHPRNDPRFDRLVTKVFNFIIRRISKLKLHDMNSGVMAIKKGILENIPFYGDLNTFLPILAYKQGFKVTEEKIEQQSKYSGRSNFVRTCLHRFLDIITVIFITNYSKKPLHFLGFSGVIFSLLGGAISLYLFVYRITGQGGIAGRPLLLLGVFLLVVGIQLISIGLIGEMIIFTHAKDIKEYNIEEIIE